MLENSHYTEDLLASRSKEVVDQLLTKLRQSHDSRKRLTHEVSYLTNKVDELSAALLTSKMRIGELEASTERLNMRLQESSNSDLVMELRQRLKRGLQEKEEVRCMLSNTRVHVDTLTSANALLQSQLMAQHRAVSEMPGDISNSSHDLKNIKIAELKQTIQNLKNGFRVREKQLMSQVEEYQRFVTVLKTSQARTRDAIRGACELACDSIMSDDEDENSSYCDNRPGPTTAVLFDSPVHSNTPLDSCSDTAATAAAQYEEKLKALQLELSEANEACSFALNQNVAMEEDLKQLMEVISYMGSCAVEGLPAGSHDAAELNSFRNALTSCHNGLSLTSHGGQFIAEEKFQKFEKLKMAFQSQMGTLNRWAADVNSKCMTMQRELEAAGATVPTSDREVDLQFEQTRLKEKEKLVLEQMADLESQFQQQVSSLSNEFKERHRELQIRNDRLRDEVAEKEATVHMLREQLVEASSKLEEALFREAASMEQSHEQIASMQQQLDSALSGAMSNLAKGKNTDYRGDLGDEVDRLNSLLVKQESKLASANMMLEKFSTLGISGDSMRKMKESAEISAFRERELEAELSELQEAYKDQTGEMTLLLEEMQTVKADLFEMRGDQNKRMGQVDDLLERCEELEGEISDLRNERETLIQDNATTAVDSDAELIQTLKTRLDASEQERSQLLSELSELQQSHRKQSGEMTQVLEEIQTLKVDLSQRSCGQNELMGQVDELLERCQDLQEVADKLKSENAEMQLNQTALSLKADSAAQEVEDLHAQLTESERVRASLLSQLTELEAAKQKQTSELRHSEEELLADIDRLTARCEVLEGLVSELQMEMERLQQTAAEAVDSHAGDLQKMRSQLEESERKHAALLTESINSRNTHERQTKELLELRAIMLQLQDNRSCDGRSAREEELMADMDNLTARCSELESLIIEMRSTTGSSNEGTNMSSVKDITGAAGVGLFDGSSMLEVAEVAFLEDRVKELKESLDDVHGQLEASEAERISGLARIEQLQASVEMLQDRVDATEQRNRDVAKLDDTRRATPQTKGRGRDIVVQALESRVSDLLEDVYAASRKETELRNEISRLKESLREAEKLKVSSDARMAEMTSLLDEVSAALVSTKTSNSQQAERIQYLEKTLGLLNEEKVKLLDQVTALEERALQNISELKHRDAAATPLRPENVSSNGALRSHAKAASNWWSMDADSDVDGVDSPVGSEIVSNGFHPSDGEHPAEACSGLINSGLELELETLHKELEVANESLREDSETYKAEIATLQSALEEALERYEHSQQEIADGKAMHALYMEEYEIKWHASLGEKARREADIAELENTISDLEIKLQQNQSNSSEELRRVQLSLDEANLRLVEAHAANEALENDIVKLQDNIIDLRASIADMTVAKTAVEANLSEAYDKNEATIAALRAGSEEQAEEIASLQEKLRKCSGAADDMAALREALAASDDKVTVFQRELLSVQSSLSDSEQALGDANDMLAALTSDLASAREESRRSQEYVEMLRSDEARLSQDVQILTNDLETLQEEHQTICEAKATLERKLESLSNSPDADKGMYEESICALTNDLNEMATMLEEKTRVAEENKAANTFLMETMGEVEQLLEDEKAVRLECEQKLTESSGAVEELWSQNIELTSELQNVKEKFSTASQRLQELEESVHYLQSQLDEREHLRDDELVRLQHNLTAAENHVSDLQADNDRIRASADGAQRDKSNLQEKYNMMNEDFSGCRAAFESMKLEISRLQLELELEVKMKQELQGSLAATGDKVDAINAAFQRTRADFDAEIVELTEDNRQLQAALEHARSQTDIAEEELLETRQEAKGLMEQRDEAAEKLEDITALMMQLKGAADELHAALKEKEEELSTLQLQLAEKDLANEVSEQKLSSMELELQNQLSTVAALQAEQSDMKEILPHLFAKSSSFGEEISALRDEKVALLATLESTRTELDAAEEDYISASQECKAIQASLDNLTLDYEGKCLEVERLQESVTELTELREAIEGLTSSLNESKEQVEALQLEVEELSQEKQYLSKTLTLRTGQFDVLTQEHKELLEVYEELSLAADSLRSEARESEHKAELFAEEKRCLSEDLAQRTMQFNELSGEHSTLERRIQETRDSEHSLRDELAESKRREVSLEEAVTALSEERENLSTTLRSLEEKMEEARAENVELAVKLDEVTQKTASRDKARTDHFTEMEASLASSKNTVSEWRAECARLLSLANEERDAKETAVADVEKLGHALMESRNTLEQSKIGFMVQIEELKDENVRLQSNQWHSEAESADGERVRDLEARLQHSTAELTHSQQQVRQLLSQYEEMKAALEDELSRAGKRAHDAEMELREMMIAAGDERTLMERKIKVLQVNLEEVERAAGDEQMALQQHIDEITSRLKSGTHSHPLAAPPTSHVVEPSAEVIHALRLCSDEVRAVADEVSPSMHNHPGDLISPDADIGAYLDEVRRSLEFLRKASREFRESQSALASGSSDADTAKLIADLRREVADSTEMMEFQRKKIESLKQIKKQLLDEVDQLRDITECSSEGDIVKLMQNDLSQAKARIATLTTSLERYEEENRKLSAEIEHVSNGHDDSHPDQSKGVLTKLEATVSELEDENESLKDDNNMLSTRLRKVESARVDLSSEVQRLQATIVELEARAEEGESGGADVESLQMNIRRLEGQLNASKKHEGSQMTRLHELSTANRALLEKNKMLEEATESALVTAEMQLQELEELRERLKGGSADEADNDKLMLRDLQHRCKALQDEREAIQSQLKDIQSLYELEKAEYEEEITELQRKVDDFDDERANFKEAILQAFQQQTGSGGEKTASGGIMSGLMGSNKKYTDQIASLQRTNAELKHLEKLRPQLLELQQQLADVKQEAVAKEERSTDEIATLTDHNQKLAAALIEYKKLSKRSEEELEQAKALVQQLTDKVRHVESEGRQLAVDLEDARFELEQMRAAAVDPLVVQQLESNVQELENEKKHWQRKAQSYSKELVRRNTKGEDITQLRDANLTLKTRVEELMAERDAFKEAMISTVDEANPEMPPPKKGFLRRTPSKK